MPLIRRLWASERVDHRGGHFRVPDAATAARPVQHPGPPIWIGAQAEPSVRCAARLGDAWYVAPFPSRAGLLSLLATYRDERSANGLGVPAELPIRRKVFVGETHEQAVDLAERGAGARCRTYGSWSLELDGSPIPEPDDRGDAWMRSRYVVGTADDVVDQLQWLQRESGFTTLGIKVQWPDLTHCDAMAQLERFGTDVVPRLG